MDTATHKPGMRLRRVLPADPTRHGGDPVTATTAASGAPARVITHGVLAAMASTPAVKPARRARKPAAPPVVRKLSETDYQKRITDYATVRGWLWVHFRPARTEKGWRTAVSGPLGVGWLDLFLIRPPRLAVIEVKTQTGPISAAQKAVLALFDQIPGVDAMVARPSDWDRVQELLA